MKIISPRTIAEVKEHVRLLDIVSESVALKLRGSNYVGLCPFHNEKTPSFHVRDSENSYHCFGCGASGNAITFVMERQGLSFPEAIVYLANRLGINVLYEGHNNDHRGDDTAKIKNEIYNVNTLAFKFFRQALQQMPKEVADYYQTRGLDKELINAFGIGYAPLEWHALVNFLRQNKVSDDLMMTCGLARRNQKGELYDTYRGRVMFPIFTDPKRIAGFGGRVIPALISKENGDEPPKYINSPESAAYQKNKILYALPQAIPAAKAQHALYLVEGYMDVISLWKVGVQNVVAPCGTALTENQVKRISSLVPKVYVFFDGDKAGRAAAARSFSLFLNSGIEALALFLPQDDDPDTIARRYGKEKIADYLKNLEENGVSLLDCHINSILHDLGLKDNEELSGALKARAADVLAQSLKNVSNDIERNELIKQAAFRLLIDENDLKKLVSGTKTFNNLESLKPEAEAVEENKLIKKQISELPTLDREILHIVMAYKEEYTDKVLHNSLICSALDPATLLFIEGLSEILNTKSSDEEKKKDIKSLLNNCGESWLTHWKKSYQMLEDKSVDMKKAFKENIKSIERSQLTELRKDLQARLQRCQENDEKENLINEILAISKKLAAL